MHVSAHFKCGSYFLTCNIHEMLICMKHGCFMHGEMKHARTMHVLKKVASPVHM